MIPQHHPPVGQLVGESDDGNGPRGEPFGDRRFAHAGLTGQHVIVCAACRNATIAGVALDDGLLTVRSTDFGAFSRSVSGLARRAGVSLHELLPTDESLESVFSYLVRG